MISILKRYSLTAGLFALVGVLALTGHDVSAATTYDFSSSTAESNALIGELVRQAFLIFIGSITAGLGIAMVMMGAGFVYRKFKKFTGLGKKL